MQHSLLEYWIRETWRLHICSPTHLMPVTLCRFVSGLTWFIFPYCLSPNVPRAEPQLLPLSIYFFPHWQVADEFTFGEAHAQMADESPTPPTPNLSFDAEQMEKHCPPPSPTHTLLHLVPCMSQLPQAPTQSHPCLSSVSISLPAPAWF